MSYNTPTYSAKAESVSHYTEYEMSMYSTYMEYVEQEVTNSDLPSHIKLEMMEKRHLHKKNNGNTWYLEERGFEVSFLPFKSWLLQTERDQKLEQLGL